MGRTRCVDLSTDVKKRSSRAHEFLASYPVLLASPTTRMKTS
jgi:hypothetical protein